MSLKILFMGTPEFAVPILKSIYESNYKILEVYTQSPKKKKTVVRRLMFHQFTSIQIKLIFQLDIQKCLIQKKNWSTLKI